MRDIVAKMQRKMSVRRVVLVGVLLSGVALVLIGIQAILTDGGMPQTFMEWFCAIAGAVIVWPVVVAVRLCHGESGFVTWPLWLASGLLWSLLVEWILVKRYDHEA